MSKYNLNDKIYIKNNEALFKKYGLEGAYNELISNKAEWEYNNSTKYFKGTLFSNTPTQINIKKLSRKGRIISIPKKNFNNITIDLTIDLIFDILGITKNEPYGVAEHSESRSFSRSRSRSHSDNAKLFTSKQVRAVLHSIPNCNRDHRIHIEGLKNFRPNGDTDEYKDNKIHYTLNGLNNKAVSICKSMPNDRMKIRTQLEENLYRNKIKFEDIPSDYQIDLLKLKEIRDKYGQSLQKIAGPSGPSPQEIAEELISNLNIIAEAVKIKHITYNTKFIAENCYNSGSVNKDIYYYDLLLLCWYNPNSDQFETLINLLNNADHPFVSNKVHLIEATEFKTRDFTLIHAYLLGRLNTVLKLDVHGNGDKKLAKKRYIDAFQNFYTLKPPLYLINRVDSSYLYLNNTSHKFYFNKSSQQPKPKPAADPVCYICGRTIHNHSDNNTDHIIPVTLSYITGTINFPLAYSPTHRICNQSKTEKIPLHLNEVTGGALKNLINKTLHEEPNHISLVLDNLETVSPEILKEELKKRGYTKSSWWKFWGGSPHNSDMDFDKESLNSPSTPLRTSSYRKPVAATNLEISVLNDTIDKLQSDFTNILKRFNNNIINSPNDSHIAQLFTIIQLFSLIHFLILQKDCIEYSIINDTYAGGKNKQQGGNNIKDRITIFLNDITPSAAETQYGHQIWPLNKRVDFFITRMVIYYHYSKTLVDAHKTNMNKEASYSLYSYYTAAIENLSKNITVTVKPDANDF